MSQKQITPEQIEANYNKFISFIEKIKNEDIKTNVKKMLEVIEERLALAPASSKLEQHSCFAGGLVDHSLKVLSNAIKVKKTFFEDFNITNDSLIVTCLFHDLGKIGDLEQDYYLPQDSQWHQDKLGEMYKINKELDFMTVPHRSLWFLQHFNISLAKDEMLAIMLHDGQYTDENRTYRMREVPLVDIIHTADFFACKQEKGYYNKC